MTAQASVLAPITVTDAMLSSATIAEPSASETAWVSASTYVVGDKRIRTTTHRVYKCAVGHTGRTALPEVDETYWEDIGPTDRWAMFDSYVNTKSQTVTTMSVVLRPGFFNALVFYGFLGGNISITAKDAPGGATYFSYGGDLIEPFPGLYELLTRSPRQKASLLLSSIPLRPDPEVTITITAGSGSAVGVGMLAIGDLRSLLDDAVWGGTESGATAEPTTTSYIKVDDYGNVTIKRRLAATDMSIKVVMPKDSADYALASMKEVLDVPACWIGSDAQGYGGLNVFGLARGVLSYDSNSHAVFSIQVKGIV